MRRKGEGTGVGRKEKGMGREERKKRKGDGRKGKKKEKVQVLFWIYCVREIIVLFKYCVSSL
jgi:hypothetical protein